MGDSSEKEGGGVGLWCCIGRTAIVAIVEEMLSVMRQVSVVDDRLIAK